MSQLEKSIPFKSVIINSAFINFTLSKSMFFNFDSENDDSLKSQSIIFKFYILLAAKLIYLQLHSQNSILFRLLSIKLVPSSLQLLKVTLLINCLSKF